uniref:Chitin-binding type-2 domain-containing protein n=1 Tax=Panagrellus redivivus TaxID=6233 RepID=A0A7E4ULP8_PANRE
MKCLIWAIACLTLIAADDVMKPDFCVGRENGRYAYGCRQDYVVCLDGVKSFETCEGDLYYSHYDDRCLPPWEFDLCAFEQYANEVHVGKTSILGTVYNRKCPVPQDQKVWKGQTRYSNYRCKNTYFECLADEEGHENSTEFRTFTCPPGLIFYEDGGYCRAFNTTPVCPKKVEHHIIDGVETIVKPANWDEVFPWPVVRKPKTKSYKRISYGTVPAAAPYPNNGYNTLPYGAQPSNQQFAPQQPNFNQQSVTQGPPIRAPKLPFNAVPRPPVAQRPPVAPAPVPVQPTQGPPTTQAPQPHRPILPKPVAPQPLPPQKPVGVQPEPIAPSTAAVVDLDCSTRADGIYATQGCVNYFFKCVKGVAFKYECPVGFFFSSQIVKCVSPQQVTECQGQQIIATTVAPPSTTAPPAELDVPKAKVNPDFCVENNFTQGYHHDGCSSLFYGCNGIIAIPVSCPLGKFYDPSDNTCDDAKNVHVCGGTVKLTDAETDDTETIKQTTETNITIIETKPSTQVQPQPQPPITIIEQPSQQITTNSTTTATTTSVTSTYCADNNLSDGIHGFGCNGFFYNCHAGITYQMPCPGELVYSNEAQACDEREFTPACGGTLRVITNITTVVNETSYLDSLQYDSNGAAINIGLIHNTPVLKTDFQCGGRVDGFYVVQNCLPTFIQCSGDHAYIQACPAGLLFDIKTESCNYKEQCGQDVAPVIQEAHGNLGQLTGQTQTLQPGQSHIASSAVITNTTTTTISGQRITTYDCSSKANGFFQIGRCASTYVECLNKVATSYSCPDGLVFNDNVCQHPDICAKSLTSTSSASSSSTSTSTVTTTSRQTSQNGNVGTVQQPPRLEDNKLITTETKTLTEIDTVCVNRPDGYIAEGCASIFYSCLAGAATKVKCPTGLFYDVETQACYPKENVVACGGQSISKTQTTTWTNITTTTTNQVEVCDKPDGSYADDCTSNYYVCTNGNKIRYQCPAKLIFSDATGACDYKERVERCGGTPATSASASQTASTVVVTTTRTTQSGVPASRVADLRKPENVCANLIDGIYGRPCSRFFLICRNHVTTDFICPQNTAFNVKNGKCEEVAIVPGCQKESAPTLTVAESQYRRL